MTNIVTNIGSWRQFANHVRTKQTKLLRNLHEFEAPILITGCQRSGGTMLSRVITASEGMTNFWFSKDEELDAALILSGAVEYSGRGRHCFQTTYLNERWSEYLEQQKPFSMVWTLRNPLSVTYSMVYNWKRYALNELFVHCGLSFMSGRDMFNLQRFGTLGVPPLRRAAYAYVGKVSQLLRLQEELPERSLTVLEYDQLVTEKQRLLPNLYQRLRLDYHESYADRINERSLDKRSRLDAEQIAEVEQICNGTYAQALKLINLA